MGASAGGIEACRLVLSTLPRGFPASIFITIHTAPASPGLLNQVIGHMSPLPVEEVRDRHAINPGHVYVAPPNLHLLVKRGWAEARFLPKENGTRPAIDPMFRTAAHSYGRRVIGVLMTGNLDDGVAGLGIIKDEGGITVVQDPKEAAYPDMPLTAVQMVPVDHIVSLAEIATLLVRLVSSEMEEEPTMAEAQEESTEGDQVLTCPGCGGVLHQYKEGNVMWYKCQIGHRYTLESVMSEQDVELENRLWGTLAILKQKEEVARTMAADARSSVNSEIDPEFFDEQARAARKAQELIEKVLDEQGSVLFPGLLPKKKNRQK